MFVILEEDLYRSRGASPDMLDEYDRVCEAHHGEVTATIGPALADRFGGIPVIPMYKQASVRWQKAHDFRRAVQWAERGLAVYGDHGLSPEAVEDLQVRIKRYREKLGDG